MVISVFSAVPAFAAETSKSVSGGDSGTTGDCAWSWSGSDLTRAILFL